MIDANKVLQEFSVTEKATGLTSNLNQYTFQVSVKATRHQVAEAIERTFGVTVSRVNVMNVKPTYKRDRMRRNTLGRKSAYKKAVVTLKEGDTIEMV